MSYGARSYDPDNDDPGSALNHQIRDPIPLWGKEGKVPSKYDRPRSSTRDRNGKRKPPTSQQKLAMFQTERASWWTAVPRTPCEAAWRVPAFITLIREVAEEGDGPLVFPVTMPDGSSTMAVFRMEVRTIVGRRVRVVFDPLHRTIYTGCEVLG